MFKKYLFAVAGFMTITATAAKADCANASNPFDEVYCDIQVFHQADHQLNVDYSDLYKVLNQSEQSSLKHGEIMWIKDRNEKCTMSQDGFDFVAMDCAVQLTNDRDNFIKDRARECSSTGCIDSAIGKENESQ